MGLYIKRMEVPPYDGVFPCRLRVQNGVAKLEVDYIVTGFMDERKIYAIVPVPDHGDLIDRDALPWEKQGLLEADEDWALPASIIESAPIVIPAEKEWPAWRSQVLGHPYREEVET